MQKDLIQGNQNQRAARVIVCLNLASETQSQFKQGGLWSLGWVQVKISVVGRAHSQPRTLF